MWIARTIVALLYVAITIYDFNIGNFSAGISDITVIILLGELAVRDYIDKEAE